jgi:secernin
MKSIFRKVTMCVLVLAFVCSTFLVLNAQEEVFGPCDSWVALSDATKSGITMMGKNSDRSTFDCQPLIFVPGQKWPANSSIKMERVTIPQVGETYAHLGSAPYWCWGYEEGINEFGVSIGNEGIQTMVTAEDWLAAEAGNPPELGFTGMDLVRLGLERGKTAREAIEVITSLLEQYGQFGAGLPQSQNPTDYDNSYLIADPNEAWVLETTGKLWIAQKFTKGTTSISNQPAIRTEWDLASPNIIDYAVEKGWWPKDRVDAFDFAWAYVDTSPRGSSRGMSWRVGAYPRVMASRYLLNKEEGNITLRYMMGISRDQHEETFLGPEDFGLRLKALNVIGQWGTASGSVAVLPKTTDELPVYWWAAGPTNNGCYVPFFPNGSKLPEIVSATGTHAKTIEDPAKVEKDTFSPNSYWWLFRDLTDKVGAWVIEGRITDWDIRNKIVRAEFDTLEKEFEGGVPRVVRIAVELRKAGKIDEAAKVLDDYTAKCIDKVVKKVNELREQFK